MIISYRRLQFILELFKSQEYQSIQCSTAALLRLLRHNLTSNALSYHDNIAVDSPSVQHHHLWQEFIFRRENDSGLHLNTQIADIEYKKDRGHYL